MVACSSYADATYRKRRNASSSTRLMADDPIHNRDLAIADPETAASPMSLWATGTSTDIAERRRFGLRRAGLRSARGCGWGIRY